MGRLVRATGSKLLIYLNRLVPGLWGHGFNEQIFGVDEQVSGRGPSD